MRSKVYNIHSCVLLNIKSWAKCKGLYIQYNTDTNVVNYWWNKNVETFVYFKNGEDFNDLSWENSTKSSQKAV